MLLKLIEKQDLSAIRFAQIAGFQSRSQGAQPQMLPIPAPNTPLLTSNSLQRRRDLLDTRAPQCPINRWDAL